MEEIPCDFVGAASAEILEEDNVHVEEEKSKKTSSLDNHFLLLPPTSDSSYNLGALEDFNVGRFYKIDHSNLPPDCPVQIKCVSIVMVSGKGEGQVHLRYPSLHSLRTHFNDQSYMKKIPELDEKYTMGVEFAIKMLCRSITAEEFAQKRNSWSFWSSPTKENFQNNNSPVTNDASTSLVSKQGSCWSQLTFTGMMQWGHRRQVRFLGRCEEKKVESLHELHKEKGVISEQGTNKKKRKNVEEELEAVKLAPFGLPRMTRQCKKNQQGVSRSSGAKKSMKAVNDAKKQQLVVYGKNKRRILIDRWSADRYKLAEESVLKVMKEKEAVYGNPIMRADLRSEARKYIGDTGLLDHLLKHMAGKVAPGGVERFRRRHNAEGSMEYWLESADLVDIRQEMGVQDPYWTPPPGWKPGDSILPDHVSRNELRKIKEDINQLMRDMQELASKKREEASVIVATPSSCLSSLNCEDYGSQVSMLEIYMELVHKKAKIEEQLKEISLALNGMEDQLRMLKEPVTSEPFTPQPSLVGPTSMTESEDTQMLGSRSLEDRATKIARLRSGFQICKPRGTFLWPNMSMSSHVAANLDEHTMVLTPGSASSSTTSPPMLISKSQTHNLAMALSLPSPSCPFKPLAERRAVSTTTLAHVTVPFSPPLETPKSTIPTTITKSSSSINLNESPLDQE